MTRRSMNEIEVMVKKAGVGAGLPPGNAADLGSAARLACAAGDDGIVMALGAMAQTGALSVDGATVSGPLPLAAPTAIDLALAEGAVVQVHASDCTLLPHYAVGLPLKVTLGAGRENATIAPGPITAWPVAEGADIAPDQWAGLEPLAAKTYVPATEESRASGAGAGEIDND